jgi:hypothetical protein
LSSEKRVCFETNPAVDEKLPRIRSVVDSPEILIIHQSGVDMISGHLLLKEEEFSVLNNSIEVQGVH